MHPTPVTVRSRLPDDVPALAHLVAAQQPVTGYPGRWPLPFPVEEFVVREPEVAAWVAVEDDGTVVGHVSLLDLTPSWDTEAWVAATGLEAVGPVARRRTTDPLEQGREGERRVTLDVGGLVAEAVRRGAEHARDRPLHHTSSTNQAIAW